MPYRRRREYRRARLSVVASLLVLGALWLLAIFGFTYSDFHAGAVGAAATAPIVE